MPFSADAISNLQRELVEIFDETRVPEDIVKYCNDNGIHKVMAFADLAESKTEIVQVLSRIAGLDQGDPLKCQPIKSAWRTADAQTKASLEVSASGKEAEPVRTMGPTERARVDDQVEKKFNFRWPAALLPCNALLTKIEAVYRKHLRETPRIQEARSILDKGAAIPHSQVTFTWKPGSSNVMGATTEDDEACPGVWAFRTKHLILMIAYVQADAPDFQKAELTTMLDYHEWIMNKLHGDPRPRLGALIDADFRMRTEWMLSITQREFATLTACVKHHRSESIHLFSGLQNAKQDSDAHGGKRPRGGSQTVRPPPPQVQQRPVRPISNGNQGKGGSKSAGSGQGKGAAMAICSYYNRRKGCDRAGCNYTHKCNVAGCNDTRPAWTHH